MTDPPTGARGPSLLLPFGPLGRPGQPAYAACALSPKAAAGADGSWERVLKRRGFAMRVDYEMGDIETLLSLSVRFPSQLPLLFSPLLFRDRLPPDPLTD